MTERETLKQIEGKAESAGESKITSNLHNFE